MKVSKAGKIWLDYHQIHSKKNTVRAHSFVKDRFCRQFGDYDLNDLSVDNILDFMNQLTEGRKPQTKRARFTSLLAFFNFAKNNLDPDAINPCDSPMLRKPFRTKVKSEFDILGKETVDEIIFRTSKARNRLMLDVSMRQVQFFMRVTIFIAHGRRGVEVASSMFFWFSLHIAVSATVFRFTVVLFVLLGPAIFSLYFAMVFSLSRTAAFITTIGLSSKTASADTKSKITPSTLNENQ
jgi:hypothetical protein